MNLEKDIVREIKKLIVFTAIIFLCIWKYEVVFQSIHWILDVIMPFLIGGAIAFIIGIPVSYIEKKLLKKKRKWMPYALLISAVIAVTALVPVFGAFAGCAIGMILIFIESPSKVLLFLIIFLVLQQIEGNLIYPKVVGNSVGLPSIWVLVAVTTGGRLMGVIGMLLFIPIASVSYALFREVIYLLLKKRDVDIEKI